jgi:hypothetical protein
MAGAGGTGVEEGDGGRGRFIRFSTDKMYVNAVSRNFRSEALPALSGAFRKAMSTSRRSMASSIALNTE